MNVEHCPSTIDAMFKLHLMKITECKQSSQILRTLCNTEITKYNKIPRKELNGIVLVCEKLLYIVEALGISTNQAFAHTDSLVSLHWINKNKNYLNPYVSNRVAKYNKAKFKSYLLQESRTQRTYVATQN